MSAYRDPPSMPWDVTMTIEENILRVIMYRQLHDGIRTRRVLLDQEKFWWFAQRMAKYPALVRVEFGVLHIATAIGDVEVAIAGPDVVIPESHGNPTAVFE